MAIEQMIAGWYKEGSGYVLQTLLGDLFIVALIGVVGNFVVAPLYTHYRNYKFTLKNVPSPEPHWLLGDLNKYSLTTKGLKNMIDRCKEYPSMSMFRIGWLTWQVQVYHPDLVKLILNKRYPKGELTLKMLKPILRDGLITSSGDHWKRHRRMLNPIFNFDVLKSHVLVFNKNCDTFLKKLEEPAAKQKAFNVTTPIGEIGFSDIMECVMSRKPDGDVDGKTFVQWVYKVSTLSVYRTTKILYMIDAIWNNSPLGRKCTHYQGKIIDLCLRFIKERRKQLALLSSADQTSIKDDVTGEEITIKRRKGKLVDFLDILIQTKDDFDVKLLDDEIIDEVVTIFGAGQETTAAAIGWVIYMLAEHPTLQEKCRTEINEIMEDDTDVTWSHISALNYVTMFIKETLRLNTIISIMGRTLTEDLTFKDPFDQTKIVTLPKGTTVTMNMHALHHNPHIWENPNEFIPERFLPENTKNRSPYAFIPFSAGHRNCIGQNFAMNKIKVFACKLLKNYQVYIDETTAKPLPMPGLALIADNGMELKFRKL